MIISIVKLIDISIVTKNCYSFGNIIIVDVILMMKVMATKARTVSHRAWLKKLIEIFGPRQDFYVFDTNYMRVRSCGSQKYCGKGVQIEYWISCVEWNKCKISHSFIWIELRVHSNTKCISF